MPIRLYQLAASIAKETRVLRRDRQALLILFVMPVVFVLIMSLALRDAFSERAGIRFDLVIVDHDGGEIGERLETAFRDNVHFRVETRRSAEDGAMDEATLRAALNAGDYKFALWIPARATTEARERVRAALGLARAPADRERGVAVRLLADPALRRDHRELTATALERALEAIAAGLITEQFAALAGRLPAGAPRPAPTPVTVFDEVRDAADDANADPAPTSVQQNAPAWTLFAMFFLVIPLSGTLIKERQEGSLTRLRSMPVPGWVVLGGKVVPYFAINQIQVLLILLVGIHLLPRLGGDALVIGDAPGGIALISIAASLAAIGYGLAVASFARTPEQATTFGGVSVLILAALGGVLVPKLVMPPALLELSAISPLSWGLDGFLAIFVRGADAAAVLPEVYKLLGFALACFAVAVFRFQRGFRRD
jgi:ABC-2 type transport system permease protein